MSRKLLGQELVERGVLTREQLDAVLEQQDRAERLGESLVSQGLVSKEDIGRALESIKGVAYAGGSPTTIDPEVRVRIPGAVARRCCALPLSIEGNTLVVAMAEPQNVSQVEELAFSAGMEIETRFSFADDVRQGLERFYPDVSPASRPDRSPGPEAPSTDGKPAGWFAYTVVAIAVCIAFAFGLSLGDSLDLMNSGMNSGTNSETNGTSAEAMPSPFSMAVLEPLLTSREDGHVIQVGVYRDRANALQLAAHLRQKDERVQVTRLPGQLYSVTMGPFPEQGFADRIASEIREEIELSPFLLPGD